MGIGQRTIRSVAVLLLLVTVGSVALWLRDGIRSERDERVEAFLDDVRSSAEYTAGYAARQGLSWIRHAAASLDAEPSASELAAYAQAQGFSAATVFDASLAVVSAWGPAADRAQHRAAVERSIEFGGPRVAGADDADRAQVISVAIPYQPERHVAVTVDVADTAVDWYLTSLAATLGAEVALVDGKGVAVLDHAADRGGAGPAADALRDLPPDGRTRRHDGDVVAAAEVAGTPWRLAVHIGEERLHGAGDGLAHLPWLLVGLIVLSALGAVGLLLRLDTVRRRAATVQAQHQRLVDHLQEGLVRTSLDGDLQMANRAALRLLGFEDLASARRATGGDIMSMLRPEDVAEFRRRLAASGAVTGQKVQLREARGTTRPVSHLLLSAQYVRDRHGRPCAVEGLVMDVTERHRVEQELRRRDLILESAAGAASTLLREPEWERAIHPALAELGTGAGVDRVFVFGVTTAADDPIADYLHEWVADGVPASIDLEIMHDIPMRAMGFERWIDILSEGGTIVGDAASFPPSEQALLELVGARSLLVVPVATRDGWWGFVGFAQVTGSRTFPTAEADALRMAAEVIGAAVDRSIDHVRLQAAVCEEARAAEALRAAGQVRDDFLSMVSHELRTPLTPILGFSHLLERPDIPLAHRQRGVGAIRRNARRMLSLVDDLLVYSRATSGRLGAVPGPVDLHGLVTSVIEDLDLADDVALVADGRPVGWIDEAHLGHIVANLVTNACKYGDGRVRVEVGPDGPAHVTVRVVDEGDGVPPAFVPHLFERFTQASTGDRRTASGTGLGLAIVRVLVEANGASVAYRPNVPTGACFEVRIPTDVAVAVVGTTEQRLPAPEPQRA